MRPLSDAHRVTTIEQLAALVGEPNEISKRKETTVVTPAYRAMIESSPFVLLATHGPHGLDISPRGDPPGFVVVEDERTLLLPERRGNNRVDSLRNLVVDPRIALLFLIPGVGETLRVRGTARISVEPALCERLAMGGAPARFVVAVDVHAVYFQCARALVRSRLWERVPEGTPRPVPTPGRMLAEATAGDVEAPSYDDGLRERQERTLY